MTGVVESLCTLAGEALVAVGSAMRTRREGFSEYEAGDFLLSGSGRMESDGPEAAEPIPTFEVRGALNDVIDSTLLHVAATVIEGWTPLLLKTSQDATDVDLLVAALRDRAAQFEAVERDLGEPFASPNPLRDHLTNSPRRGQ